MLAKKIALNTIISAVVRIIGMVVALIIIGLLTRYFNKNDWGEYTIMATFGAIFSVLAEFGLYQIMTREISRPQAEEEKIASNIFTFRLIFSLFIFALAPIIALLFPYSNQARWGILIGMIGFWFLSDSQVLMGVFQKYLRMDKVALAEIVGRLVQLGLTIWFVKKDYGFLPLVAVFTLSCLVNFILIFTLTKKHIKLKLEFDFSFWQKIIKQSYPLALSNILVMVYFSVNSLILSVFKPAVDVGIFRLAYKVLESLIFFPAMFVGLIMPLISKAAVADKEQFKRIFQRSHDILLIFGLPLVLGMMVLASPIIALLGGGKYPEAEPALVVLMAAVGAIFLGTLFSYVLIAINKQKTLLFISATGAVFNLLFNFIFIPLYSYQAAAWGSVLTESLVSCLMLVFIWKNLSFFPSFKTGIKSLLAAAAMASLLWFWREGNLFLRMAAGVVIYFPILYLIRGFSYQEISQILKGEDVVATP